MELPNSGKQEFYRNQWSVTLRTVNNKIKNTYILCQHQQNIAIFAPMDSISRRNIDSMRFVIEFFMILLNWKNMVDAVAGQATVGRCKWIKKVAKSSMVLLRPDNWLGN